MGTVRPGVVVPSTVRDVESTNLQQVLVQMVSSVGHRWGLVADSPLELGRERRLPVGGSVEPILGRHSSSPAMPHQPLTLSAASGTWRHHVGVLAGDVLANAVDEGASAPLQRYSADLKAALGRRQQLGRFVLPVLGHPAGATASLCGPIRSAADLLLRSTFDISANPLSR